MATAIPEISTATTVLLTLAPTGYFGRVTSISMSGMTRPSIDITHFGTTTQREFMPGDLYDPGQIAITAHFDATQLPPFVLTAGAIATTLTITFPGAVSSTLAGSGFLLDASWEAPLEDVMVGTFTWKFDGLVAELAAA